jgi:hypothetical protein
VATGKKGIASTELSRKLGLGQKTCRYFKRKEMRAMQSSDNYPLTGRVDVDEFFVGRQEKGKKVAAKRTKNWLFLRLKKGTCISRMCTEKVTEKADAKNWESFMQTKIESKAASKRTNGQVTNH